MGYSKNNWIHKKSFQKVGGKIIFPVAGKRILEGSSIEKLLLNKERREQIEVHGRYQIIVEGSAVEEDDFTEEFIVYIESVLIGATIEQAWMSKDGSLTINVNSDPTIRFFVSTEGMELPIEKWTYDHDGSYLTN